MINYMNKFSPVTAEVCTALHKFTWVKQIGHEMACIRVYMMRLEYNQAR